MRFIATVKEFREYEVSYVIDADSIDQATEKANQGDHPLTEVSSALVNVESSVMEVNPAS